MEGVELLELTKPYRGHDVAQVAFEARQHNVVPPRILRAPGRLPIAIDAVPRPRPRRLDQRGLAGQHAALCRGQVLGRIEAERAQRTDAADDAPAIPRR